MKKRFLKAIELGQIALMRVFSVLAWFVLLVAMTTVTPIAKAWHSGRLYCEHAAWHQQQNEIAAAIAAQEAGEQPPVEDDRPVGLFL